MKNCTGTAMPVLVVQLMRNTFVRGTYWYRLQVKGICRGILYYVYVYHVHVLTQHHFVLAACVLPFYKWPVRCLRSKPSAGSCGSKARWRGRTRGPGEASAKKMY